MKLTNKFLGRLIILVLVAGLIPSTATAAGQLTSRSLTISSSSSSVANATTTYTFHFTFATGTVVQSFQAQACTTASGTCTLPTGFANASATITQPTGLGATSGWTVNTATAGSLRMLNSTNATAPSGTQTVIFNNVQNPTTPAAQTYYLRITTYSDATWTTVIDDGNTATATANQITFNGTIDESLTFCVGITVTGNCTSTTGTAVTFSPSSTFSTTTASTASSQFAAATNAGGGYVVTVNGATLTSGARTIAAAGVQSPNGATAGSVTGTSQFGMNVPTASITNASSQSVGTAGTNYGTAAQYRYFTGDTVATTGGVASDFNTYTANYIVNISGVQAAGAYATTLTFICTATF